jgi:hypothetical protein
MKGINRNKGALDEPIHDPVGPDGQPKTNPKMGPRANKPTLAPPPKHAKPKGNKKKPAPKIQNVPVPY